MRNNASNAAVVDGTDDPLGSRLAVRLAALREGRGWSLDRLAEMSGISRATLSRLERGETSPTAMLLGKLCAAHGMPMSRLIAEVESQGARFMPHAVQSVWIDPETGYRRRSVSPPSADMLGEVIEGELPPGADIRYDAPPVAGLEQHIWLKEGQLDFFIEGKAHRLTAGDCLRVRLYGPTRFLCPPESGARYAIFIVRT
jgi:transcriptional regulator with XRE-family HTH domain